MSRINVMRRKKNATHYLKFSNQHALGIVRGKYISFTVMHNNNFLSVFGYLHTHFNRKKRFDMNRGE